MQAVDQFYVGNSKRVLQLFADLSLNEQSSIDHVHQRALLATGQRPTDQLYTGLYNQINGRKRVDTGDDTSTELNECTVRAYEFMLEGDFERAIELVSPFQKNIEAVGIMVLCFLMMGRRDIAEIEVKKMKEWADDSALAQLVEAWTCLCSGPDTRFKEMIYVFEELTTEPSVNMINGHAACLMLLKRFSEAEEILLDALKLEQENADATANLIVCYSAMNRPLDAQLHTKKLTSTHPNHTLSIRIKEKSALFDKLAKFYKR